MALSKLDVTKKEKVSPPPINEQIVSNGKATQALIRFLIDLRRSGFNIYDEVDNIIDQVNLNIENIDSLQEELDNTQDGAGLKVDGSYLASLISNYINSATSLSNADILLDAAIHTHTRELIVTASVDTTLSVNSQTVLVNASSGAKSITLPSPASCFDGNRSLRFAIHKIDTSANVVTILPNGSELVVGETSQELILEGETYNFITDGTNWYLGA